MLEEAYEVRAISFWGQEDSQSGPIQRKDKRADGRGQFSHFPHVVLNQARVHDFLLETMAEGPAGLHPCCTGLTACCYNRLTVTPSGFA